MSVTSPGDAILRRPVTRVTGRSREVLDDALAVERALQIRVDGHDVAVTLRTPGHDRELALGFLAGEGVLAAATDVRAVATTSAACDDAPDLVEVSLAEGRVLDWTRLERHFAATAACGLCGRAHLDALRSGLARLPEGPVLSAAALLALPARVRRDQHTFEATGGLHAAVWCDAAMEPRVLREDVGRHNAVDKVCGWLFEQRRTGAQGRARGHPRHGRRGSPVVARRVARGVRGPDACGLPARGPHERVRGRREGCKLNSLRKR
ncbi:MAG: hypothetical protein RL721_649 [Candidatus Eisenbacteria bacterium]